MVKSSTFIVKQEAFEGPLDLLLSLIEKRKLSVTDVSLARVTGAFLEELKRQDRIHLRDITLFLNTAATLLLIKSRALLPTLELTQEESVAIEELEVRLELYRLLREKISLLKESIPHPYVRLPDRPLKKKKVWPDPSNLSLRVLAEKASVLAHNLSLTPKNPEVKVAVRKSIEEVIAEIEERIKKSISIHFKPNAAQSKEEKYEHIITFLALLELVKQNSIELSQNEPFGTIELSNNSLNIPHYA